MKQGCKKSNNPWKMSLISIFTFALLISFGASADLLKFRYLTQGHALNPMTTDSTIETFSISEDRKELFKLDGHVRINSSFEVKEDANGNRRPFPLTGMVTSFETNNLAYDIDDVRFGSVNLAFWMGRAIDNIAKLNIPLKPMRIKVYAHCDNMMNAFFAPSENIICIGHSYKVLKKDIGGRASIAWDADVIVHELGHGIFKHLGTLPAQGQYFSYGNDMLGAMNEGQADFYAYSTTAAKKIAPWMVHLMKEEYRRTHPDVYARVQNMMYLRALDNQETLQRAYGEIHKDGEIMAGTLYDLSVKIGVPTALKIWLASISNFQEHFNFFDVGKALLQADKNLNNGANQQAIFTAFQNRYIFGQAPVSKENVLVRAVVIDKPEVMKAINTILGAPNEPVDNLNSNGKLDAGECVAVEIFTKNNSDKALLGVEFFAQPNKFPKGVENVFQTRNYIGKIEAGQMVPQKVEIQNPSRPWLYLCANNEYTSGSKLPIIIRNVSNANLMLEVQL